MLSCRGDVSLLVITTVERLEISAWLIDSFG